MWSAEIVPAAPRAGPNPTGFRRTTARPSRFSGGAARDTDRFFTNDGCRNKPSRCRLIVKVRLIPGDAGLALTVPSDGAARRPAPAQPTISVPAKKKAISVAAFSALSDPWTELASMLSANSARTVPAAALAGLVAPITSR